MDSTKETRGEVVEFLEKVGLCGRWPQACSTMFFTTPKDVTSERPTALMPTMMRCWEVVRAPEVAKRQHKYRIEWDATDGRSGGAERTVWEILLEMERFQNAGERNQRTLVLDLAKAFDRRSVFQLCGFGRRISNFEGGFACVMRLEHQRRVQLVLWSC